ncbi:MAG: nucleotidyl transferase AbiEii/AbiGii toxin family protein [Acidimicrobiia bacterium]|nr:nucleotidyl transferase AbiEii/AbiGii toxin family protein [Acidimicrobiia bacterium]
MATSCCDLCFDCVRCIRATCYSDSKTGNVWSGAARCRGCDLHSRTDGGHEPIDERGDLGHRLGSLGARRHRPTGPGRLAAPAGRDHAGAWEFVSGPTHAGAPGDQGDPWIELRALIARRPDAPVAVAYASAVWNLGCSAHQPDRGTFAHSPGWRPPSSLSEMRAVSYDWVLPTWNRDGLPVWQPATTVVAAAARPGAQDDWPNADTWLPEVMRATTADEILAEAEGRGQAATIRTAYLAECVRTRGHRRDPPAAAPGGAARHLPRPPPATRKVGQPLAALRLPAPRPMITEGFLARHHMGRRGMAGPALLDVAQDYALHHLKQEGAFEAGLVLKGGTALRKYRSGNAGRFSTDLDFAAPDAEVGELAIELLDGANLDGVRFAIIDRDGLRGRLEGSSRLGDVGERCGISTTSSGSVRAR